MKFHARFKMILVKSLSPKKKILLKIEDSKLWCPTSIKQQKQSKKITESFPFLDLPLWIGHTALFVEGYWNLQMRNGTIINSLWSKRDVRIFRILSFFRNFVITHGWERLFRKKILHEEKLFFCLKILFYHRQCCSS